jgi:hypothetical protein
MKSLFTFFLTLFVLASSSFAQQLAERPGVLYPDGHAKAHPAPPPFLMTKQFIPMGQSPLLHDPEILGYFSTDMIDQTTGALVTGQWTTFQLPDTTVDSRGLASDGVYIRDQYMERFTASDVNFFLDSVQVAFFADTVPSRISCWVIQDTANLAGFPGPHLFKPLAAQLILKSSIRGKDASTGSDSLTIYTVPFKHLLIQTNDVSPNSFHVSLSLLTSTVTTGGQPFFGVPSTKNRIFVLTDRVVDNSGRAADPDADRFYYGDTRLDGNYAGWGNMAHNYYDPSQSSTTDTAWLYPNMFMIAYVSYNSSGVNDVPLTGNALAQNYPNPFNPSTEIKYSIAKEGKVSLKVYNTLGVEVATLVNDIETSGEHEVNFYGDNLPSGTYFYTLTTGAFSTTKRMVLAK